MIFPTLNFEQKLWSDGFEFVCGMDEVGRGAFAGPVVAAGVIFSKSSKIPSGIADSKLLSARAREELSEKILKEAVCFYIAEVGVDVINTFGIGKATQQAFLKVVTRIRIKPDFVLIDAFYIDNFDKSKQKPIISGDKHCVSIAAASIIAKVYRDRLMVGLDKPYPGYGLGKHKGYGTKEHREAIKRLGLSEVHRKSFNLSKYL